MNFHKYKYKGIYIRSDNSEDSAKLQNLLFSFGIYWYSGDNEPLYLDIVPIIYDVNLYNERPNISYTSNLSLFVKVGHYDPKIYTIDDYYSIKSILKYGELKPSYKPKKIERTLEKVKVFNNFLIESNYYEETSWTTEDGNITVTIQEINNYLKNSNIIKIPVSDIEDMCIHKDKDDRETIKRSKKANLYYPIIIAKQDGEYVMILDGHHRLKKAMMNNVEYIKAKILDLDNSPKEYKILFGKPNKIKYKIGIDITNESIKDLMKPKSKDDIKDAIINLIPREKLEKGIKNDVPWLIKLAFDEGAKSFIIGFKNQSDIKNLSMESLKIIFDNSDQYTKDDILGILCQGDDLDKIKFAVDNGANVNSDNHIVLREPIVNGNVEIVKYLLEQGANPNRSVIIKDESNDGWLLYLACSNNHYDVAKLLLDSAYMPLNKSIKVAKEKGYNDILKLLLKYSFKYKVGKVKKLFSTNESIKDLMKPKSEEDIKELVINKLKEKLDDDDIFKELNQEDADNLISEYINHINDMIKIKHYSNINVVINTAIRLIPVILYEVKNKFNLQYGGVVENGYSRSESLIINRNNVKDIYEYLEDESHWGLNGEYRDIIKTWDMMEEKYPKLIVKLSIVNYTKNGTYDDRFVNYVSFIFDVGLTYNPVLVFNSNHVDSPYIWLRTSNYSWVTKKIDEFELLIKKKEKI